MITRRPFETDEELRERLLELTEDHLKRTNLREFLAKLGIKSTRCGLIPSKPQSRRAARPSLYNQRQLHYKPRHKADRCALGADSSQWVSMSDEKTVKTFYAKPAGDFGLVEMSRESKKWINSLMRLLRLLKGGCIKPVDRDRLMATWKQYDRSNVRCVGDPMIHNYPAYVFRMTSLLEKLGIKAATMFTRTRCTHSQRSSAGDKELNVDSALTQYIESGKEPLLRSKR